MTKLMRRLPTILAAVFMLVQVRGLADYAAKSMGADDLRGLAFALVLEGGVFACAYWMRQSITRKDDKLDWRDVWARVVAFVGLLAFMAVSGYLNTAKSLTDLPAQASDIDRMSAVLFGLAPTCFAALLGILQGFIDRLPVAPPQKNAGGRMMRVYALVDNLLTLLERRTSTATPAQGAKPTAYKCTFCGASVHNPGSHSKWHCAKNPKSKAYRP